MKTLLVMYVGSSIFLVLISLPLILRKIKPNPFYGFRIQQTLDDPGGWYETNQYFAKRLFITGILEALRHRVSTSFPTSIWIFTH